MITEISESETLLTVERLSRLDPARRAALLQRGAGRLRSLREPVSAILRDVRERGDAALLEYAERFDGARPVALRVSKEKLARALHAADPDYLAALRQATEAITTFHQAQRFDEPVVETAPGVRVWRVWRPIERVGVYVPGGGALYPSCLLMAAIPATVAGCSEIAVCTPAGEDGLVPAPILAAAALAGVTEVYAVGGAHAIAAMAYGTQSIRKVDKIFGAGGPWVAEAKAVAASDVAIDLPAGPSEILIIADDSANPAWLAADLLAQAEHGPESACVLVTISAELAARVRDELTAQLATLATAETMRISLERNGALLVTDSLDEALDFANTYAPEHLELATRDAELLLDRVRHAGSVFIGDWTPEAAGDYATGGNHTLPTAGYARGFGPLSLEAFGRKMQAQRLEPAGLARIRSAIETLATTEELPGHAASVRIRFERDGASASGEEAQG